MSGRGMTHEENGKFSQKLSEVWTLCVRDGAELEKNDANIFGSEKYKGRAPNHTVPREFVYVNGWRKRVTPDLPRRDRECLPFAMGSAQPYQPH